MNNQLLKENADCRNVIQNLAAHLFGKNRGNVQFKNTIGTGVQLVSIWYPNGSNSVKVERSQKVCFPSGIKLRQTTSKWSCPLSRRAVSTAHAPLHCLRHGAFSSFESSGQTRWCPL